MPTLFERVDEALAGSQVSVSVSVEAENLVGIATMVAGLISDPPDDFQDVVDQLGAAPLPDLDLVGNLGVNLNAIREAIPDDVGDIPETLLELLKLLEDKVGLGVTNVISQAAEAVTSLHTVFTTDLSCGLVPGGTGLASSGGAAAGGDAGGDGDDAGGDGEPAGDGDGNAQASAGAEGRITPAAVDRGISLLDRLPTPMNVVALLHFLNDSLPTARIPGAVLRTLPIFDDLKDPLATLIAWEGMGSADLQAHLSGTFDTAAALVDRKVGEVATAPLEQLIDLSPQFDVTLLEQTAVELATRYGELQTAIETGDLSGTAASVSAINASLDQYEAHRAQFLADVSATLETQCGRLSTLPEDLSDQMHHVVSVLQPTGSFGRLAGDDFEPVVPPEAAAAFQKMEELLGEQLSFFQKIADLIDFTGLQETVGPALDEARGVLDQLDQAMVSVTLQLKGRLADAEALVDQVDVTTIVEQAETTIEEFGTTLTEQLGTTFEPARTAIAQVIGEIDGAVDGFDPGSLQGEVEATFASIVGVFEDPEVVSAIDSIRGALESVTVQIEGLSFAPLVDQVVGTIEELTEAMRAIDPETLSTPLKVALNGAVLALPQDLAPVTDPIVDEFGELVESGPVPVVVSIKAQPQKLFEQLNAFEPAALLAGINGPFSELIAQMEAFSPAQLVARLDGELDGFKARLQESASPGAVLQPLTDVHANLMSALDGLSPAQIVEPIQQGINQTVDKILEALPFDEILGPLNDITGFVEHYLGVGDRFLELLRRIRDLANGLEGSAAQVDAWVDEILDKIEALADTSSIEASLGSFGAALDRTRSAELSTSIEGLRTPLAGTLATLDPAARLTTLVRAHGDVPRATLDALPDSAEKTAIQAALDRFDPADPAASAPYSELAQLRDKVDQLEGKLATILLSWDASFHAEDGFLACLREEQAPAATLRAWIEEAVEHQIARPLKALLLALEIAGRMVGSFVNVFEPLLSELSEKLNNLLAGPDSLGGIRDLIQGLVDQLQGLNVGFLTESLESLFGSVHDKLEAVSPANLQVALDQAFATMLDAIGIDAAIPPASIEPLESSYAEILDKLRPLDPQVTLMAAIQPEFEATVLPVVQSIDLTPTLDALTAKLGSLDEELRLEMERVNVAYKEFLSSVPEISLLDIDLDIDIDVDIDVGVGF